MCIAVARSNTVVSGAPNADESEQAETRREHDPDGRLGDGRDLALGSRYCGQTPEVAWTSAANDPAADAVKSTKSVPP